MTLYFTINETLKRLPSLPILMQKSFWWCQCSDRYITSLFPPTSIPPPFSPSLLSLMVSVDVKHRVYLLLTLPTQATFEWEPNDTVFSRLTYHVSSHLPLKTTHYSSKLDSCIKTPHSQHRGQREGQENLEWERVIGPLTSATMEENLN